MLCTLCIDQTISSFFQPNERNSTKKRKNEPTRSPFCHSKSYTHTPAQLGLGSTLTGENATPLCPAFPRNVIDEVKLSRESTRLPLVAFVSASITMDSLFIVRFLCRRNPHFKPLVRTHSHTLTWEGKRLLKAQTTNAYNTTLEKARVKSGWESCDKFQSFNYL